MRSAIFLLVIVIAGCNDPEDGKREIAQPLTESPTSTDQTIRVNTPKPAATDSNAEAVIHKLLLAHTENEPKRIEKLKAYITTRTGEWNLGSGEFCDATIELSGVWPELYRASFTLTRTGSAVTTMVSQGQGRGWKHNPTMINNAPQPLMPSEVETVVANARAEWMLRLVPLLDPTDRIAELLPADMTGPDAVGLRIWIRQNPPAVMIIDKKTSRLQRIHVESRMAGRDLQQVMTLSNLKSVAGVLLPHQIKYSEGVDTMTNWKTSIYQVVDHIDPIRFEKP